MAASVRVEDEAFADPRIETLAAAAGYNRFEALGRMAHLWRACAQKQQYAVSESVVNGCLGPRGVDAIVTADLGERVDGGVRIKGTRGRIEWLGRFRENGKKGGRPSKKEPKNNPIETQSKPNGNPIETQHEPERNLAFASAFASVSASKENTSSEQSQASVHSPTVIELLAKNGKSYHVTQAQVDEWSLLFPRCDVLQQLRGMRAWLDANPRKRKSPSGMVRFIVGWLQRTQAEASETNAPSPSYYRTAPPPEDIGPQRGPPPGFVEEALRQAALR